MHLSRVQTQPSVQQKQPQSNQQPSSQMSWMLCWMPTHSKPSKRLRQPMQLKGSASAL